MSASARKYMSKRQRPCDFCRSRKTACRIEASLPCRLCALHDRQCTFLEAAQPRKRPTDSALGRPAGEVSSAPGREFALPRLAGDGTSNDPDVTFSEPYADLMNGDSLNAAHHYDTLFGSLDSQFFGDREAVISSEYYQRTEPLSQEALSPLHVLTTHMDTRESSSDWPHTPVAETQLDTSDANTLQALGYSGDMDPYLLQAYQYDTSGTFKFKQLAIQSVTQGNTAPVQFLLSQPGLFSSARQEVGLQRSPRNEAKARLQDLVSIDTGHRLISLFRRFILPQYPIFSEIQFPDPEISPAHLLAAIYLIAQPFASLDDVLSIELAYETLNNEGLYILIHEALQYEAHAPDLATVQTMLLLVVRPSTNPLVLESSVKWSLHGTLVSTSQTLGLHYDPSQWSIAPWQIALRRRISSTIFVIDKWLACSLGRPPLIVESAWLVVSLNSEDDHTSGLGPQAWSKHRSYSNLGVQLGEILSRL